MLGDRYKQFKDDYRKEAEWQRELQETISKQKQNIAKKQNGETRIEKKTARNAQIDTWRRLGGLSKNPKRFEKAAKSLVRPWILTKYMGQEGDGVYFVIFIFSVIFDLISVVTGGLSGAVSWIPGIDIAGEAGNLWLVAFANAVIVPLYLLVGHYKKMPGGRGFGKVLAQFMFSFLEMIPGISILPGFIMMFLINYWLVLIGRAVEDQSN